MTYQLPDGYEIKAIAPMRGRERWYWRNTRNGKQGSGLRASISSYDTANACSKAAWADYQETKGITP